MKMKGLSIGIGLFAMVSMNAALLSDMIGFGLACGVLGILNFFFAFSEVGE